jgi:hypothetical protein
MGKFGQFRDMLEQRPNAKFYQTELKTGTGPAVVNVTFVDPISQQLTAAENTWSSNLHFECTSSLPFFDGLTLNRPTFDASTLNLSPVLVKHDLRGNIHIG